MGLKSGVRKSGAEPVRAVLDVLRRPERFSRRVVPLVEERVKSVKNERLILFLFSQAH